MCVVLSPGETRELVAEDVRADPVVNDGGQLRASQGGGGSLVVEGAQTHHEGTQPLHYLALLVSALAARDLTNKQQ